MDVNNLNPYQIIAILVFFIGIIFLWNWANSRALDHMGPVHLHKNGKGALFIQVKNDLIEYDTDGNFVAQHDLTTLGLEKLLGDFAFFNNGDILLAKRQDLPGIDENLSAYKRETNKRPVESGNSGDGLFRCSLQDLTCERFGNKTLDFGRAFHLYISPEDESVYVADSSRHSLRKYSQDGTELASRVTGFKFPNQLLVENKKLYIADTNHHSIHVVKADTDNFAQTIEMNNVIHPEARESGKIWPSSLARVGTHWWVNNMGTGMAFGSVDIYDDNWEFKKSLNLPEKADPVSILEFNDQILISDFNLHRIYQFDRDGEVLRDFHSPELEQVLSGQLKKHRFYKKIQIGVIALFIICVLIGILLAIKPWLHR